MPSRVGVDLVELIRWELILWELISREDTMQSVAFQLRFTDGEARHIHIGYALIRTGRHAIFEFGHGFYGNTYTSVLSTLTLTPGPLQIFVTGKAGRAWERS